VKSNPFCASTITITIGNTQRARKISYFFPLLSVLDNMKALWNPWFTLLSHS